MAIETDVEIEGMEQVELQQLERSSAEKLLKLSLRPTVVTETQCDILLDMTGGFPLAIRLISSAMKFYKPDVICDKMLKPLLNAPLQNEMKGCIEYSYQSLEESEKDHLNVLSVVETSQFDIEIVKAVLETGEKDAVFLMMKLTSRQIVQRVHTTQNDMQYCFHPLIFNYIHNLPKDEQFSLQAQNNFCKHMLERIEPYIAKTDRNYASAIAKVSANKPLLKVLFHVLSVREDDKNDLLSTDKNRYLSKLQEMIQMTQIEKEQLYKNITEQMQYHGRQHSFVFWKLEEIQMMVDSQQFSEAEEEISALEKIFFDEIVDDASSEYLKGRFWYVKGRLLRCKKDKRLYEAVKCFKKSLEVFKNIENVPEEANALNALGNTYFDSGNYDRALSYHKQAADRLQSFSSDSLHPDIAVYQFNIGTIYMAKARQELSIYKCVTEEASKCFEEALQIFKDSMVKDVLMGTDRMPKYADKLTERAKASFHLKQYKEAVSDMKRSLEIKIAPFQAPHQNITLEYFNTGRRFLQWRETVKTDTSTAKLLLKEAVCCFRHAEDEMRSDSTACLTETDKIEFISLYEQIANDVTTDEAQNISSFCEWFESESSSSSGSPTSPETPSPLRQEHSDTDEDIRSDNNADDQANASFSGISCVEIQKLDALHFEQEFFNKVKNELSDSKKRPHSSSSESD